MKRFDKLVFLDFETTQAPEGLRAVEVALVLVERGEVTRKESWLFNSGVRIDDASMGVHGITNQDVAKEKSFAQRWPEMKPILSQAIVIAHNASFDASVLHAELKRNGLMPPPMEWWCTWKLSKEIYKGLFASYSLDYLRYELNLKGSVSHRAADDAAVLHQLFESLLIDADRKSLGTRAQFTRIGRVQGEKVWPYPQDQQASLFG